MSRCNIILKEERNPKKEIILYQHDDGHPSIMIDTLSKMLYDIYSQYDKYGDVDWFLDSSKVSSKLILDSVYKIPEELSSVLSSLDSKIRNKFEIYRNIEVPTIVPEQHRTQNCNYEYIITLKETVDPCVTRGYTLEVVKLNNGKKVQEIVSLNVNLFSEELVASNI